MGFTLDDIAKHVNGKLHGNAGLEISGANTLDKASASEIAFISQKKYIEMLKESGAGAVLMSEIYVDEYEGNRIVTDNPHVSFASVAALFNACEFAGTGIHSSASIAESATLGEDVAIGANAVIGPGAMLGANVSIAAGCYIGRDVVVGEGTLCYPNVVIHCATVIGENCIFHSGSIIGGDGFGYARDGSQWIKVPQLGKVIIGDNVEIGSSSTVDRGALDDTILGDRVKIDNLVQIGHNVTIGEDTIIAAGSGVAGSTHIGKRCSFGGMSGVYGHLQIVDDVEIAARSSVTKSIRNAGIYSSGIRVDTLAKWQKNIARLYQLDELARRIKMLERTIKKLGQE